MFSWMKPSRDDCLSTIKPPAAPPNFDADELFSGVHWHQRWPLFADIYTPGVNPVLELCDRVRLPADLTGKRVLDIGAWNGCFSFECERRGAAEVIALSLENPLHSGFNHIKDVLGSKVEYVQGSVYSLSPAELGTFDVVLFLGVLYHLRYPLLALDRLRPVCRGDLLIETFVTTGRHLLARPLRWLGRLSGLGLLFCSTPIWRQFRAYELHPQDQSNWFGPNVAAVKEAFTSSGFSIQTLSVTGGERATFRATVQPKLPRRLVEASYEGISFTHAPFLSAEAKQSGLFSPAECQT